MIPTSTTTEKQRESSPGRRLQTKMIRNWLVIMLPCGIVAWYHTYSVIYSAFATVMPLVIAIAQGTVEIIRYRICYGDAPAPVTPAHGVVVVSPAGTGSPQSTKRKVCRHGCQSAGCSCEVGTRWRIASNDQERFIVNKAKKELPLRLLCIGDSLAAGVGTSRSCTPILPEVIARSLSKAMGGRAVYWTCHGSPGASSGWIVRELERGINDPDDEQQVPPKKFERSDSTCSETDSDSIGSEESPETFTSMKFHDDDEEDSSPFSEWKRRLQRHKKRFDPTEPGGYDVAVVLTGPNDLKSTFFPFLLSGEAAEFYRQAQRRGGNFANELRRVVDALSDRMTLRLQKSLNSIQKTLPDNVLEQIEIRMPQMASRSSATSDEGENSDDQSLEQTELVVENSHNKQHSDLSLPKCRRPIVVLPAMPAEALPIFKSYPLRWLAVPIIKMMDNHKKSLANACPDEVVFVESPTLAAMTEFGDKSGKFWEQRESEDALLALRNVNKNICMEKKSAMKEYFGFNGVSAKKPISSENQMFSPDGVHPNDEGYDYWGRHIANAIVREWEKPQC